MPALQKGRFFPILMIIVVVLACWLADSFSVFVAHSISFILLPRIVVCALSRALTPNGQKAIIHLCELLGTFVRLFT